MTDHPAKAAGCTISDEELVAIAREFRNGVLDGQSSEGWCAAICWPLEALLALQYGIQCNSVETELTHLDDCEASNYIWLQLSDGRALDPTIDQFGETYPDVYLGKPLDIHGVRADG